MVASYELITAPDTPAVSLAEAKLHLRIEHDAEDAYISQLVAAGASYIERLWGLALVTQTHKVTLDAWPAGGVKLRPHPVRSLTSVASWNGTSMATLAESGFQLVLGRPAFLFEADGGQAPQPSRRRAGIEVTFVCGFGATEEDVPAEIKQAILLLVSHWYENREASVSSKTGFGVSEDLTRGVEDLMAPYRSPRLA